MAKYDLSQIRLGKGGMTDNVYAGVVIKEGLFKEKVDVTNDFIACVIARFGGFQEVITDSDGNKFQITCKDITNEIP